MRKKCWFLLVMALVVLTVGCGTKDAVATDSSVADDASKVEEKQEEKSQTVEVDEGLLNVEITLPASYFSDSEEEVTQQSLEEKIKDEDGIKSVKLNDDGSVTYKMTKNKQKEMLADMKKSVDESLQSLVDDESMSFVSIEYNDDMTKFDCVITNKEPNLTESFAVLTLYLSGAYYNMFAGNEDADVKVNYVNEESGEVVYEGSYKEWVAKTEASESN